MSTTKINPELFNAFSEKLNWYQTTQLPEILAEYINMHSLVDNLFSTLLNKGVVVPDPYKKDKKISSIKPIEDRDFVESDKAVIIGARLSDYELMLDFICNYFPFTTNTLTTENIKQLLAFNNGFNWENVTNTCKSPNSRGLAECLAPIRGGSDNFATNLINNNIQSAAKTIAKIDNMLKDFAGFQREIYKMNIRKDILEHPSFKDDYMASKEIMEGKIREIFKQSGAKTPYYTELVNEVIDETIGANKDQLVQALMNKFKVEEKKTVKKEIKVDTHGMLMDAVRTLGAMAPQLSQVADKFEENSATMEASRMTGFQKFIKALKQAFGIKEQEISYKVLIVDPLTQAKKTEIINFNQFQDSIRRKAKIFNSFAVKNSPGYIKIEEKKDDAILEFLGKQLSECQKMLQLFTGLDDFFKVQTPATERNKIKGIKMEITAVKNTLVKTNQKKSEYISVVEEEAQLAKLGISKN